MHELCSLISILFMLIKCFVISSKTSLMTGSKCQTPIQKCLAPTSLNLTLCQAPLWKLFLGLLFYSEKLFESLMRIKPVTLWSLVRCSNHWATYTQYINVTFTHHPSPCSAMVWASHQRSGYGFDSCQGLTKFFWVE